MRNWQSLFIFVPPYKMYFGSPSVYIFLLMTGFYQFGCNMSQCGFLCVYLFFQGLIECFRYINLQFSSTLKIPGFFSSNISLPLSGTQLHIRKSTW